MLQWEEMCWYPLAAGWLSNGLAGHLCLFCLRMSVLFQQGDTPRVAHFKPQ